MPVCNRSKYGIESHANNVVYIWFGNLTQHTVLLLGTDDLGEHSHEVVVDGVALLGLGFLCGGKGMVSTVQNPYYDPTSRYFQRKRVVKSGGNVQEHPCKISIVVRERRIPRGCSPGMPSSLIEFI